MPLRQSRYIHRQTKGGRSNGFTIYFEPAFDAEGNDRPDLVTYAVAFCNKTDQFSRLIGRGVSSLDSDRITIAVKDFPEHLARIYHTAYGLRFPKDRKMQQKVSNSWAWVYKYFL